MIDQDKHTHTCYIVMKNWGQTLNCRGKWNATIDENWSDIQKDMKSSWKKKMYHTVYISTQKSNMFQNCFTRKDMPLSLPNLNTSTLFCFCFSFPSFCFKRYREFVIINYRAIFSRIYNTLLSSRPHKYSKIPSNHTSRPVKQEERLPTLFWAFTV